LLSFLLLHEQCLRIALLKFTGHVLCLHPSECISLNYHFIIVRWLLYIFICVSMVTGLALGDLLSVL
jgi:hypothetical protein